MENEITLKDIEAVLEESVRPELIMHGGNIQTESYEDGVLRVRLTGECSNCPSAGLTMENIVESGLHKRFPDLKIELSSGVSDELWSMAKDILRKRHGGE